MSKEPPNYTLLVFWIMLAIVVFVGVVTYNSGISIGAKSSCPSVTR